MNFFDPFSTRRHSLLMKRADLLVKIAAAGLIREDI